MRIRHVVLFAILVLPPGAAAQTARTAADSAWVRGDRIAARDLYLISVAQDRGDAVALFRLGLMANWDGRPDESIRWLDRLILLRPDDRDARVARARALAARGRLDEAVAAADSLLAAWPDEIGAITARARFAGWQRDFDRALHLWRRAFDLDSSSIEIRAGYAAALRQQGNTIAARRVIAPARSVAVDPDVIAEVERIESQLRPRVRSSVVVEEDSDGNGIVTVSAGTALRAVGPLAVSADGWRRRAGLDVATADASVTGARFAVSIDALAGWLASAGMGATLADEPGADPLMAWSASLTSPRSAAAVVTVNGVRTPLDYTLPLVRNEVVMTEATASIRARRGRNWDFGVSAGIADFDVRRTGESNHRYAVSGSVNRRLSDAFRLEGGARAFGFDRDINGGFFDPDVYALFDAGLGWSGEAGPWRFDTVLAPGVQRIGRDGPLTGAVRSSAAVAWQLGPGRQVGLRGTFANTGLQQISEQTAGAYRYGAIALSLSWWF